MKDDAPRLFELTWFSTAALAALVGCGGPAPICAAGQLQCDGDDIRQCSADGSAWIVVDTCGAGETCTDGVCAVCEAGAVQCNGDDVVECSVDGTEWTVVESCGEREACVAGSCEPVVICDPGVVQCDGDDIVECTTDGTQWTVTQTCATGEACMGGECTIIYGIRSLTADTPVVIEGSASSVDLSATYEATPTEVVWRQVRGRRAGVTPRTGGATLDLTDVEVAGDTVLTFELWAMWSTATPESLVATDTATVDVVIQAADLVPAREQGQIGGATIAAAELLQGGGRYALFNQGGRLMATLLDASDDTVHALDVGMYIRDIDVVEQGGVQYALLALGPEGIGVVDVSDVAAMSFVRRVGVNYEKLGVTFAEGGGDILTEDFTGVRSRIVALETDGTTLWIANADFGIQRTALSNLLGGTGPVLEADGTLLVEQEIYTQQYAGENPWGGPLSLTRHGGRLFAALAYLGIGIFDADTLQQVGRYNMYVDTDVNEDWFIDMDPTTRVHSDAGDLLLDDFTGMPDYRQANYEIEQVWHGEVDAPTPWADFDRYGKFYYASQGVTVADHGARTIAYIAYGLGGLVAVDVTGYDTASADSFLIGDYLGYAPGVPAHGPEEEGPPADGTRSLYPYYGAGKLKEGGVTAAAVVEGHVIYTDHFGGVVVLDHAEEPETYWRQSGGPFDNDRSGVLGDHQPDYELVTSYDMSPWDPSDHESLPAWMYQAPALLTTGEISGHGRGMVVLAGADTGAMGGSDLLALSGAGGMDVIDLDLSGPAFADRYTVLRYLPSTTEIGAAVDGSPTARISMGHTQGITSTDGYLYVGDGPHGMTVWDILDEGGSPIDDPHVVANTLQDEYPETAPDGTVVRPTTHAWGVIWDETDSSIYVMCQSIGVRRVSVANVESGAGAVGAPLLIAPQPTDIFEHNAEWGRIDALSGQDHAYDVFRRGDLAYVADGSNGLTIYDVTRDPTDPASGFFVGNLGGVSGRPPLGRAVAITLWTDESTGADYAFVAAGQSGIGVVDVTDPTTPTLVKVFEPIKIEDGRLGHADGRSVDVHVDGDHVFLSYTSFGVLSYRIADLIAPLPAGIDPSELWRSREDGTAEFDYRPEAVGHFVLDEQPGYEEYEAEALYMESSNEAGRLLFYVAYGEAGVAILDWTDPAAPTLLARAPTIHEATAVTLRNGRLYVADHDGGIAIFR